MECGDLSACRTAGRPGWVGAYEARRSLEAGKLLGGAMWEQLGRELGAGSWELEARSWTLGIERRTKGD